MNVVTSIQDVFTYTAEVPHLTLDQEIRNIEEAQAGDEFAFRVLLSSYAHLLRQEVTIAAKNIDREEAEAIALTVFTEAVYTHDVNEVSRKTGEKTLRLSVNLKPNLKNAFGIQETQAVTGFSISKSHFYRYRALMKKTEGDYTAAYALASAAEMEPETFAKIHQAVQGTSLDGAMEGDHASSVAARPVVTLTERDPYDEAEDAVLIHMAFDAVDDEEARIIGLYYGFTNTADSYGEPVPDMQIAHLTGLSRPKVQRVRSKGLTKMREALGV